MKKVLMLMALSLGMFSVANAQSEPKKGDVAVEVGFSPFRDNGETFKLNEGMLKGRYFLTNKDALRLKLGFGLDNENSKTNNFQDANDKTHSYSIYNGTSEKKNKCTKFSIALGYERHFKTIKRFDFYAGAELGYGLESYSGSEDNENVTTYYNAKGILEQTTYHHDTKEYKNQNTSGRASSHYFTGAVFTGVDFYVYKNLYLGAELGISFKTGKSPNTYYTKYEEDRTTNANGVDTYYYLSNYSSETGVKTTTSMSDNRTSTQTTIGAAISNETTNTSVKLYIEPSIRLGWKF